MLAVCWILALIAGVLLITADHTSLLQSIDESSLCGLGGVREVCLPEWAGLLFIRRFSFLAQPDVPETDFWPGVVESLFRGITSGLPVTREQNGEGLRLYEAQTSALAILS